MLIINTVYGESYASFARLTSGQISKFVSEHEISLATVFVIRALIRAQGG